MTSTYYKLLSNNVMTGTALQVKLCTRVMEADVSGHILQKKVLCAQ